MATFTDHTYFKNRFVKKLFLPVDNTPLILFRICFGFLLFCHCIRFITNGKLYAIFIAPPITFNYIGFDFLQPLPGNGMYFYFALMCLFAIMIMLGAWYRLSMAGFSILWTGIYLMQKSNYNNHYYLILLLCWLMCFVPANTWCALDVKRKAVTKNNSCPQWVPFLFIFQMAVVFIYAGFNKITDNWLSGKIIALLFEDHSNRHLTGRIYSNHYFQLLITWGGLFFDLFIVPLLLWKRTRLPAFFLFCLFNLFNSFSFYIGIFPYLSIAMAVFFFDAEKMTRLVFKNKTPVIAADSGLTQKTWKRQWLLFALGIYIFFQLILPLRSLLYPGNVFWTGEGYRMSWKMMLWKKTGTIHFKVMDPTTGKVWLIDPADRFSASHAGWMAICPDIVWQYAQRLKEEYKAKGYPGIAVYAIDSVSLNNEPARLLIDTTTNLANTKWYPFRHSEWILPNP